MPISGLSDEQVDEIYRPQPKKVDPTTAKKHIRDRYAELITSVRCEETTHLPKMSALEAFEFLKGESMAYGDLVAQGAIEAVMHPTTFFGIKHKYAQRTSWCIREPRHNPNIPTQVRLDTVSPQETRRLRKEAMGGAR